MPYDTIRPVKREGKVHSVQQMVLLTFSHDVRKQLRYGHPMCVYVHVPKSFMCA